MFGAFLYLNQNGGIPRGYLTNVSNIRSLIVGDIVQADWNNDGKFDHTMIVTSKGTGPYGELYLTYHSGDTVDRNLGSIMAQYPTTTFIGWKLLNYY
jgi:hypothetical protein